MLLFFRRYISRAEIQILLIGVLIGFPVLAVAKGNPGVPRFSNVGGFYTESFQVHLTSEDPDTVIFYTLDGSEPGSTSLLYTSTNPILIENRQGQPPIIANINTTGFKESGGGVTDVRWHLPGEVFQGTVLRARSYRDGEYSEVVTHSYFVDNAGHARYSLPVISIVTHPDNLFDHDVGIYVPGVRYTGDRFSGNYHMGGRDWERPAHIEFYEMDGSLGFASDIGIRMHGFSTRNLPQKSIRIYFRRDYGLNRLQYSMFDHKNVNEFKRLLLRNSGSDWYHSLVSDGIMHLLVGELAVDIQGYRPAIHFINGEYWGIVNIRGRQDKYYVQTNHGADPDNIDFIEHEFPHGTPVAKYGDTEHWDALIRFMGRNPVTRSQNYAYVQTQMDIESFIDYHLIQIYGGNWDYGHHNVRYWRPRTDDGRWRWMLYDTDHSFGNDPGTDYDRNLLQFAINPNRGAITFPLRKLLENKDFRNAFINRMDDLLNSIFWPATIRKTVDEVYAQVSPEMPEHIKRWNYPQSMEIWERKMQGFLTYSERRPDHVRQQFIDEFDLKGTAHVTLEVSDIDKGSVQINSILLDTNMVGDEAPYLWQGTYFRSVPLQVRAIANVGYHFKGWEGVRSDEDLLHIILTDDITLKAIFGDGERIEHAQTNYSLGSKLVLIAGYVLAALIGLGVMTIVCRYRQSKSL